MCICPPEVPAEGPLVDGGWGRVVDVPGVYPVYEGLCNGRWVVHKLLKQGFEPPHVGLSVGIQEYHHFTLSCFRSEHPGPDEALPLTVPQ